MTGFTNPSQKRAVSVCDNISKRLKLTCLTLTLEAQKTPKVWQKQTQSDGNLNISLRRCLHKPICTIKMNEGMCKTHLHKQNVNHKETGDGRHFSLSLNLLLNITTVWGCLNDPSMVYYF